MNWLGSQGHGVKGEGYGVKGEGYGVLTTEILWTR